MEARAAGETVLRPEGRGKRRGFSVETEGCSAETEGWSVETEGCSVETEGSFGGNGGFAPDFLPLLCRKRGLLGGRRPGGVRAR